MKRMRSIILLLITGLVAAALSACTTKTEKKEPEKVEAMGRYVEETLAMPEKVASGEEVLYLLLNNPENKLEAYGASREERDEGQIFRYVLQPDRSWQISSPEWLQQRGSHIISVAYGPEGLPYAIAVEPVDDKLNIHIFMSRDGINREEIRIADFIEPVDYSGMPMSLRVLSDNRLLIGYYDRIVLYDNNGNAKLTFSTGSYKYALSGDEKQLLYISEHNDSILIADLKEGNTLTDSPSQANLSSCTFTSDQEGNWFRLDHKGISRLTKNGSIWETLVDGSLASMSMPSYGMDEIISGKQEDYYAMYQYGEGIRDIKHYFYDETIPSTPAKILTVISMEENATVRQAIIRFQQNNSNVKIDYRSVLSEEGAATAEDLIKVINTELLAGRGADIYILDSMPAAAYIEKGALADISDLIGSMAKSDQMLNAVLECYKSDNAIYMAPIRFALPIAFGSESAVKSSGSIDALAEYAKTQAKVPLLGADMITYHQLTKRMFRLYSDSFLGQEGRLDQVGLVRFLDALSAISLQTGAFDGEAYDVLDEDQDIMLDAMLLYDGISELGLAELYGDTDIYAPMSALDTTGGEYQVLQSKFIPLGTIGVNQAGIQKALAYDFIRELFSYEVQKTDVQQGLPVNRKALEQFGLEENDFYISGPNSFEATQPVMEKRLELIAKAKTVTQPMSQDPVLFKMVWEEALPLLRGQTDSAAAADKIMNKATTYLAE